HPFAQSLSRRLGAHSSPPGAAELQITESVRQSMQAAQVVRSCLSEVQDEVSGLHLLDELSHLMGDSREVEQLERRLKQLEQRTESIRVQLEDAAGAIERRLERRMRDRVAAICRRGRKAGERDARWARFSNYSTCQSPANPSAAD
ncbi:Protein of unknown function, partial [Gryllus bimaculatus]